MPSPGGEFVGGDEPAHGMTRVNGVIFWPNRKAFTGNRQANSAARFSPAFGEAALTKLMSLEAEATELRFLHEIAELMEEAPGA